MNWAAGGFIFRRTDSVYHRLDPRVKLLMSLLLFTLAIISRSVPELALLAAFVLALSGIAHILKRISRTMLLTASFAAFIFILNFVINRSLATSLLYAVRFVAIVISTSLFFITTSPDELEQVMNTFHLPRDIVFAFVTAVRFIPVLLLDALQIMDAQKSRGLEMQKGNPMRRVRNMIPVLIPLVVNSVIRSGELAEAMESRAYGAVPRPTSLNEYHTTALDRAAVVASLILFALAVYSFYFVFPTQLL
jgi:energy-coupling factor transport system permease protein